MVDNDNQWEDIKYKESEEDEDSINDDSEAEEDEFLDEDESEFDEEEDDDDGDSPQTSQNKNNNLALIIIIVLVVLLLVGLCLLPGLLNKSKSSEDIGTNVSSEVEQTQDSFESQDKTEDSFSGSSEQVSGLNDSFFETNDSENNMSQVNFDGVTGEMQVSTGGQDNGGAVATIGQNNPEDKSAVGDLFDNAQAQSSDYMDNSSIMVAFNKATRENPFKPIYDKKSLPELPEKETYEYIDDAKFEIIEPPKESVEDKNLTKLLQTQISGILYDEVSPSAVVSLNGVDKFVKIGDTVSGYKIEGITKDKVQIGYKNNTYVASVGELFTRGSLEKQPAVPNLENKFAGRYKNNKGEEE